MQASEVSRRIGAPAAEIFQILADPGRHRDIDGSGTLREAAPGSVISGVGDVFVMRMHDPRIGDFEMNNHVVEYEPDRRIGWEPENGRGHPGAGEPGAGRWRQWSFELTPADPDATMVIEIYDCSRTPQDARMELDRGNVWIESMAKTLERLDAPAAARPAGDGQIGAGSASPAAPSWLNRPIQRRTVAGWHSSSPAI